VQREQLADFLRRRRMAIRPAEVGLADGPRRRTAGLRREEVAMLTNMSVDYVVRLEQGRSSQPSIQMLGALARALRLTDDERDYLFHLAGHRPPPAEGVARLARAGLIRMLDLLGDTPAMVLSHLGQVLAQNRAAVLLAGDHTRFTGDRRYLVYRWFTEPAASVEPLLLRVLKLGAVLSDPAFDVLGEPDPPDGQHGYRVREGLRVGDLVGARTGDTQHLLHFLARHQPKLSHAATVRADELNTCSLCRCSLHALPVRVCSARVQTHASTWDGRTYGWVVGVVSASAASGGGPAWAGCGVAGW